MKLLSSANMSVISSPFFNGQWLLKSAAYILWTICSIPTSFTSVSIAEWYDATVLEIMTWADVLLHDTVVLEAVSSIGPTKHHLSRVLKA